MATGFFNGHRAIVTGASSGIGRAIALNLACQGARVALAARDEKRLKDLVEECNLCNGDAIAVPTDVSDEAQCRHLIDATIEAFGGIDLLVNNAGIGVGAMLSDLPNLKLFKQVMSVNFYGQVYCTYYALPHLKASKGRILSISSLGGKFPLPGSTSYIASKYGLHGFYDSLRMDLAGAGVSATVVCPYWVVTEFHERQMDRAGIPRGPLGRALYNDRMMTADRCAVLSLRAAAHRRREVLMGPGWIASLARMISPALVDWMALKFFLEPAAKRVQKARSKHPGGLGPAAPKGA